MRSFLSLSLASLAAFTLAACSTGTVGEQTSSQASSDILLISPSPGDVVSSPLTVTGQAKGTWYFEASFPVRLIDADGNEIAIVPAQAQGDWMTEEFVPFVAVLEFSQPQTPTTGTLVLQKDNPSGLPEYDDSITIPVLFQ